MRRPLLISHDLTRSGAPVQLLALARALKRCGEDPLVVPLRGGPLEQRFRAEGIELTSQVDPATISFVIANTVLSVPEALRLKRFGILVAAWLHESAYFFRIVNVTPQQCGLPGLDIVLVPEMFQVRDLAPFLPPGRSYQLRTLVRQEWFRPPGGDATLAVCGQWEVRKGQARLLELARNAQPPCRFKFIGAAGPGPDHPDVAGGAEHVYAGSLEPEASRREIALSAALVSCAEAEVQPLSVVEALMAGRPALLSDIDAHRAVAERIPNVVLFDRASPQSFLAGYARLREAIADVQAGREASAAAVALFGEAAFDRRLAGILKVLRREEVPGAEVDRMQDA
jgi:glycosyltransferase involved in cell wall biosynthesis